ncbi:MAG: GGDEF domain-containing protein [Deltaproteobacteria bacterium]|nr:GGDEF domain-containing protein [Deltaproteobacteria bacterium]
MIAAEQALEVLLDLTRRLGADRPLDVLLAEVTEALLKVLPGQHASIRLLDETRSVLIAGARSGEGASSAPVTFHKGEGVIGWVADHGESACIDDCATDPRFLVAKGQGFSIRSILAVPLMSAGEVIGVLSVTSSKVAAYSTKDEVLARLVGNCTVPSLEKARLARLTLTDHLTHAFNQRYLMPRLREEFERARRMNTSLSILFMDLDHFKTVNDTLGHTVGDQVLLGFAERARQVVRRYDVLVRRGGEEFVLIMPGADIHDAMSIAVRIRDAVCEAPIAAGGGAMVPLTVSVGAVQWDGAESAEQLDRRADGAMYEAKKQGRNLVVAG